MAKLIPPKIDERTASDIARQVQELLKVYLKDYPADLSTTEGGVSKALISIFARFAEIIIQRLNQVPHKNLLAFLNLLGASRIPPQPARVPLTFTLTAGSVVDTIVPRGTQVAAPPTQKEQEPVIFETERELVVTATQLASIFVRDPQQDTWSDRNSWLTPSNADTNFVFRGDRPTEHSLYLACDDLFTLDVPKKTLKTITLNITSSGSDLKKLPLIWSYWNGKDWQQFQAPNKPVVITVTDTPLVEQLWQISIPNFPVPDKRFVNGVNAAWIKAQLVQPLPYGATEVWIKDQNDQLVPQPLPTIRSISANVQVQGADLLPDFAFINSLPIDLTKDFYPFGENPRLSDTLYIASQEVFSKAGATVTVDVSLNQSVQVNNDGDINLAWEIWDGDAWQTLDLLSLVEDVSSTSRTFKVTNIQELSVGDQILIDGGNGQKETRTITKINLENQQISINERFTNSYKKGDKISIISPSSVKFTHSGLVTFTLPNKVSIKEQNGKPNYWIRVRIINGNYGLANIAGQLTTFTTLTQNASKNAESRGVLTVKSVRGFLPNDSIQIASGSDTQEIQIIQSIDFSTKTLTLLKPLEFSHSVGTGVWLVSSSTLSPPLVNSLKLSYTYDVNNKTLSACQKYNDFTYENITNNATFSPFQAPQESKPTLYLGMTLPQKRSDFPDRPLSLFIRIADLKYGEKFIPLDPPYSRQLGTRGEAITHKLIVTNNTDKPVPWNVAIVGDVWKGTAAKRITVKAHQTEKLDIGITISDSLNLKSSDRAFVRLTSPDDSSLIYSSILETVVGESMLSPDKVYLNWEYWNGQNWSKFNVEDGTENFTRSGLVQFLVPNDFQPKVEFEQSERYWVRVQAEGDYAVQPRIQWLALNTMWAEQSVTIVNEVLGSSNGSANQTFRTTRFPILANQQLEVRELEKPSAQEQAQLAGEAIADITNTTEVWVQWQEVKGFYGSDARDRHYIINHLTGEITFGDGINGLIPPLLQGNLRMTRYQTGGGVTGNRPPQTIVQLKTTVPYIDRVTNYDASTGGAEAESFDALQERLPRGIRHSDRAVTLEDYEDLAMLATPEVARAKCIPLKNLIDDPLDQESKVSGDVSIIIVPRSTDIKPLPSTELINHVQDYLKARAIATANIFVVGPLYVKVSVEVEIGLTSLEGASAVEQAVQQKLTSFLHPLTGGLDGNGWDFGREPYKSDFYALLEAIAGVDHVRTLVVTDTEDQIGAKKTGRFLVYSDKHKVSLIFEKP